MTRQRAGNDEQAFVDAVEAWVEKELRPVARKYDQADEYPHEIVEQMKELGLFGATIGQEYGGLGLSAWTYAQIVIKVAIGVDGAVGHLQLAPDRRRRPSSARAPRSRSSEYLPTMATGDFRGSLGLTEPNAGSDLQAIRTTAKLDGDHYVVNGSKTWITNSMHGNFTLLLVKTDPDAEPRHKGMSMLIAEKGPGYNVVGKLKKMGYRSHRHLRAELRELPRAGGQPAGRRRGQGLRADGGRPGAGAHQRGSARRRHRRGRAASTRCAMRRNARPSASRSGSTRPCS